jgi:hypothetical protein
MRNKSSSERRSLRRYSTARALEGAVAMLVEDGSDEAEPIRPTETFAQ